MKLKKFFCLGLSCFMLINLSFGATLTRTSKIIKGPMAINANIKDSLIILRPTDELINPGNPIPVPIDPTLKVM